MSSLDEVQVIFTHINKSRCVHQGHTSAHDAVFASNRNTSLNSAQSPHARPDTHPPILLPHHNPPPTHALPLRKRSSHSNRRRSTNTPLLHLQHRPNSATPTRSSPRSHASSGQAPTSAPSPPRPTPKLPSWAAPTSASPACSMHSLVVLGTRPRRRVLVKGRAGLRL